MRILGISGSLRRDSYNTKLLHAVEELLGGDADFEIFGELESLPPYNEDRDGDEPPLGARLLRDAIKGADALVVATPEYNGSIPGQLKNAVDWASRPVRAGALWGKPVVVLGATTGTYGGVWAQADLRKALGIAGARVVDAEVAVGKAHDKFDEAGRLTDPDVCEQLRAALDALVAETSSRVAA
jgi:chromate reductase, NAD(P)H dehydrogenase (quinone)